MPLSGEYYNTCCAYDTLWMHRSWHCLLKQVGQPKQIAQYAGQSTCWRMNEHAQSVAQTGFQPRRAKFIGRNKSYKIDRCSWQNCDRLQLVALRDLSLTTGDIVLSKFNDIQIWYGDRIRYLTLRRSLESSSFLFRISVATSLFC